MGPGKIALLEAIRVKGSIRAAAQHLGMAYRTAWLLIEQINEAMREPAVTTATGGQHGGGAKVTAVDERVIELYHAIGGADMYVSATRVSCDHQAGSSERASPQLVAIKVASISPDRLLRQTGQFGLRSLVGHEQPQLKRASSASGSPRMNRHYCAICGLMRCTKKPPASISSSIHVGSHASATPNLD
jgi:molybdate transport system regulatory protein